MTKKNILNVAIKEFSYHGYDGLSMSKLASKLDVNKATIYYHFKDKQSLYQEVIFNLVSEMNEKVSFVINKDLEPKEKFRQYIKIKIEAIKENPEIVAITLREMANFGSNIDNNITPALEQDIYDLSVILKDLDLKDKYKNIDLSAIKSLIIGTINTYYAMQMSNINLKQLQDFDKDKNKIFDYVGEFITNILLDALCKN